MICLSTWEVTFWSLAFTAVGVLFGYAIHAIVSINDFGGGE